MSSTFPSAQPPQKQWWSRVSSKSSTVSYRPPKTQPTAIPRPKQTLLTAIDEKQLMRSSNPTAKPASKFNTFASAIGLKSKKVQHPTLEIQEPPPSMSMHPPPSFRNRARTMESSSTDSARESGIPRVKSTISATLSWEDTAEPLTPSDSSRHRTSYQRSHYNHDPFAAVVQRDSKGALIIPTDPHRLSVMSDPSLMDPHMKAGESSTKSMRSSQTSPSIYGQSFNSLGQGGATAKTLSSYSAGSIDVNSSIPRDYAEDQRFLNTNLRPISNYSGSTDMSVQSPSSYRSGFQLSPTERHPPLPKHAMPSSPPLPKGSVKSPSTLHLNRERDKRIGSENCHVSEVNLATPPRPPQAPSLTPHLSTQSSQTSFASSRSNSVSKQSSYSPTASTLSVNSNGLQRMAASGSAPSLLRQVSSSRIRALGSLPPTSAPPPTHDLPPTPGSAPPQLASVRTKLSNPGLSSPLSVTTEELSIMSMDLPPSSPSSHNGSSSSLSFAPSRARGFSESSSSSWGGVRGGPQVIANKSARTGREDSHQNRQRSQMLNGPRPSTTSSSHVDSRAETPTSRPLKKSSSQQSLVGRARAESSASGQSVFSNETFGPIPKTLKKQRSMHNTRVGLLNTPTPLPSLRHASSFGPNPLSNNSTSKGEGSQSRRAGTPNTTSNSTAASPNTPQKKRAMFAHSTRDRDDWNQGQDEWVGLPGESLNKKGQFGRGMGLSFPFSNTFFSSSSAAPEEPHAITPPQSPSSFWDQSPPARPAAQSPERIGEHILPPAELLSRIEALADTRLPPSPPQFAREENDDWVWGDSGTDGTENPQRSPGAAAPRRSDRSPDVEKHNRSTPLSTSAHHFASPTGSITERLQSASASQSRLPTRRSMMVPKSLPVRSAMRPSTTQALGTTPSPQNTSPLRGLFTPAGGLPPPPRRPGSAVADHLRPMSEVPVQPLPPPPSRDRRPPPPPRAASRDDERRRVSIMRKSSFLNIGDESAEAPCVVPISAVPEDSFLDLERGKDSLEALRSSEDSNGGFW